MKNIGPTIGILFSPPNPVLYECAFAFIDISEVLFVFTKGIGILPILASFIGGLFLWLLVEYFIHRFVFHHRSKSVILRKVVYAIHGVHHAFPTDHQRLYVPFVPALFMKGILMMLFCVVFGWLGLTLLAGLVTMHQFYNLVHYFIHTDSFPHNPFLNRLRANHLKHHRGHGEKCFGVTSTFFDRLFGTL